MAQEVGKRLEAGKRGFTDNRIGQRVCSRAQTKADAWVFSLSNWCHLMSWGKQGRALLGEP